MGGPITVNMYEDFAMNCWVVTVKDPLFPERTYFISDELATAAYDTPVQIALKEYATQFGLDQSEYTGYTLTSEVPAAEVLDMDAPNPFSKMKKELAALFPILDKYRKCPICGCKDSVRGQVIHLNDNHRVSREDIATWIDGLEGN